jgi:hypothetical protein
MLDYSFHTMDYCYRNWKLIYIYIYIHQESEGEVIVLLLVYLKLVVSLFDLSTI